MSDRELIEALLQENAQLRKQIGTQYNFRPGWYIEQKKLGKTDEEIAGYLGINRSRLSNLKSRFGLIKRR